PVACAVAGGLVGGAGGHGPGRVRRAIERLVMVNDGNIACRKVDIELETVRPGGHADVERRDGVFRTEIASAAMREDLRAGREERAQGSGLRASGADGSRRKACSNIEPRSGSPKPGARSLP